SRFNLSLKICLQCNSLLLTVEHHNIGRKIISIAFGKTLSYILLGTEAFVRGYGVDNSFHYYFCTFKRVTQPAQIVCLILAALLLFTACEASPNSPPVTLNGHVHIDGSTALQPLVSKAATLFHSKYPQVQIIVDGGGSVTGLGDVTSHKVDIG